MGRVGTSPGIFEKWIFRMQDDPTQSKEGGKEETSIVGAGDKEEIFTMYK